MGLSQCDRHDSEGGIVQWNCKSPLASDPGLETFSDGAGPAASSEAEEELQVRGCSLLSWVLKSMLTPEAELGKVTPGTCSNPEVNHVTFFFLIPADRKSSC